MGKGRRSSTGPVGVEPAAGSRVPLKQDAGFVLGCAACRVAQVGMLHYLEDMSGQKGEAEYSTQRALTD